MKNTISKLSYIGTDTNDIRTVELIPFKNLSQFKKAVNNATELHGERYVRGQWLNLGVRKIIDKQTNSFSLETPQADGTTVNSWCAYPKASECEVTDNVITIFWGEGNNRSPILRYRLPKHFHNNYITT